MRGNSKPIAKWSSVTRPKTRNPQKTKPCINPGNKRPRITFSWRKTSLNTRQSLSPILSRGRDPVPFKTILRRLSTSKQNEPRDMQIPESRTIFSIIVKGCSVNRLSVLQFFCQFWNNFENISHYTIVSNFEQRCVFIFIDDNNILGSFHAPCLRPPWPPQGGGS